MHGKEEELRILKKKKTKEKKWGGGREALSYEPKETSVGTEEEGERGEKRQKITSPGGQGRGLPPASHNRKTE